MHDSKLLILIQTFEESELSRLLQFLDSPYFFNGKKDVEAIQLYEYIVGHFPDLSQVTLGKEQTYAALYPNQAEMKGKMDRLMTRLMKHIQLFLAYEQVDLQENKIQRNIYILPTYRERHLDKLFHRSIDALRKSQNKIEQRGKSFYYNQFLIEGELTNWESFYNTRKEDLNLTATLQSLDIYYMVAKLEYACLLLAQNKYHQTLDIKNSLEIIDRIAPVFEQAHYVDIPILNIYYHAFLLLRGDNPENAFDCLSTALEEQEAIIPLDQMQVLQSIVRSYCIRQYNSGNDNYLEKTFKYYRLHLEKGYLLYEDGLIAGTFRNIVAIGLKHQQFDWVMDFMDEYKNKIVGTKHPVEVYHFNLAAYYFALSKYDEALEYLADNYEDIYYKIAAKRMELKIYYEQESVLLDSKINAFKVYIFRISKKLLTELTREGNNNFIDFLKRILSPKTFWNKERVSKLIKELDDCKVIIEKEWLRAKLNKILNRLA